MKEIRIKKIDIENFKGFEKQVIDFSGLNTNIYGTNETGKTTIADAFYWCLFGKDSLGADTNSFAIKPKDKKTGLDKHKLLTKVVLTLIILENGNTYEKELVRTYEEKWTIQRGSVVEEMTGHTSSFYINGVPKLLKDYQKEIAELVDENLFKTLTNVNHFNSLNWKDQRSILLKLDKNFDYMSLLEDRKFLELKKVMKKFDTENVEDIITKYKNDNKAINSELERLPTKILTLNEQLANHYKDIEFGIGEQLENERLELEDKLEELEQEKVKIQADIKNKATDFDKQNRINSIKAEIKALDNSLRDLLLNYETKYSKALTDAEQLKLKTKNSIELLKIEIENTQSNKAIYLKQKEKLYADYDETDKQVFTGGICSYCKQPLPTDKLEELKASFNLEKANKLELITEQGLALNEKIAKADEELETKTNELGTLNRDLLTHQRAVDKMTALITKLKAKDFSVLAEEDNKKIGVIAEQTKRLNVSLENELNRKEHVEDTTQDELALAKVNETITYVKGKLDKVKSTLILADAKFKVEQDINTYSNQLASLQAEYESNLTIIALAEEYQILKVSKLEENINSFFKLVKFNLFERQINGGIKEVCYSTINGVPYSSVNNAGRINAGLDIINVLQSIYQIKAPIFIDNAEASVKFLEMESQLIKLYVSEKDLELRVVKEG